MTTTRPATPPSLSIERTPSWSSHRMFLKGYGTGTIYHIQERKTGAGRGMSPEWLGFDPDDETIMREIARRWNSYPRLVEALKEAINQLETLRLEKREHWNNERSNMVSAACVGGNTLLRSLGEIDE